MKFMVIIGAVKEKFPAAEQKQVDEYISAWLSGAKQKVKKTA